MKRFFTIAILGTLTGIGLAAAIPESHADERRSASKEIGAIFQIAASEFLSQQAGVDVQQQGNGNQSAASQNGPGNSAGVFQKGGNQKSTIDQSGKVNRSNVSQYGYGNSATMSQQGKSNYACLIQVGVGLEADVSQKGKGQRVGVLQTPSGSREISPAACFIEKVGRTYIAQRQGR